MSAARCADCANGAAASIGPDPDVDWTGRCVVCGRAIDAVEQERPAANRSDGDAQGVSAEVERPNGSAVGRPDPDVLVATRAPAPTLAPVAVSVHGSATRLPRPLLLLAEWRYARRATRDLQEWYQRVQNEQPALKGRALYSQILARRSGLDARAAERVLRRAEQSFSDWSSDRDLRFRDVVLCLVFEEWSRDNQVRVGAQTHMERVVSRIIPRNI